MEHLKITNLCVGDWVIHEGHHRRVAFIDGANGLIKFALSPNFVGIGAIEPIPITPEILEKNGWKLSKSNWFKFEDGEWEINIWIGKYKCNIEVSQKREIYAFTYADIQVVKSNINTLQHALRWVGIEKEITL